ncbi:FecR family protein [Bacteroides thetaiotaomicron]|nr:FecR family protein [Bacteroides thetaiotaomicron]
MNQNLLLKYISGKASQREKEEVAAWIDADAANLKEFMSLRKSYDALVWQDADELKTGRDKLLSLRTFTMKAMRIAAIFVLAFGLSYILIQTLQKENVEMQTVYVPAGQRTQVTLADGTMVWVNGKSTLTFPSQFASRTRKVELDGEAYFEVQKDPEKQFIVSTAHQSAIKVLGTKFNVKAYRDSEEITTTLIEGKVHFEFNNTAQKPQYITMAPGQKLIYYSQSGKRSSILLPVRENWHGRMVLSSLSRHLCRMLWRFWQTDMMWNLSFDAMCPMMTCSPGHSRAGAWSRY